MRCYNDDFVCPSEPGLDGKPDKQHACGTCKEDELRNDRCIWFGSAVSLPLLLPENDKAHITAGLVAASLSPTSSSTSTTSTPIDELELIQDAAVYANTSNGPVRKRCGVGSGMSTGSYACPHRPNWNDRAEGSDDRSRPLIECILSTTGRL